MFLFIPRDNREVRKPIEFGITFVIHFVDTLNAFRAERSPIEEGIEEFSRLLSSAIYVILTRFSKKILTQEMKKI
jgi:hypothetical protein